MKEDDSRFITLMNITGLADWFLCSLMMLFHIFGLNNQLKLEDDNEWWLSKDLKWSVRSLVS
jgi:hypothetical protein